MAKFIGTVVVDIERCKGCALCVAACPLKVLGMSTSVNLKGYHYVVISDDGNCVGCTGCAQVCPDDVLSVYRIKI